MGPPGKRPEAGRSFAKPAAKRPKEREKVMKGMVWSAILSLLLFAGATPPAAMAEPPGCDLPKVDNFVVLVDQSGSMYQRHADLGEVKELLAKRTLLELND